jgi:hypothetical protein
VDAKGLHTIKAKVRAVMEAPAPTSVTELKAYLGLLNYYNRFLPNLSTLYSSTESTVMEGCGLEMVRNTGRIFCKVKGVTAISRSACALLSRQRSYRATTHRMVWIRRYHTGFSAPIRFMSITLLPAEKKYSQLDKEGLAVIFRIQRSHKYNIHYCDRP